MTGYGRAVLHQEGLQLGVEILSVNRKHLDFNIISPRHFARFDPDVRKILAAKVFRGHVTVRITALYQGESPFIVRPNLALVDQLAKVWQDIALRLKLDAKQALSLELLGRESELFIYEEDAAGMERSQALLFKALDEALVPFLAMRCAEGGIIQADIASKLKGLREKIAMITVKSHDVAAKLRQKLFAKLQEILPALSTIDDRLMKEIAIYAEKADIDEEILRFNSHLDQFEQLFKSRKDSAGKTAEFLLQELGRETNTIGSKTTEIDVSHLVVDMKSELERIREQIQNIE